MTDYAPGWVDRRWDAYAERCGYPPGWRRYERSLVPEDDGPAERRWLPPGGGWEEGE